MTTRDPSATLLRQRCWGSGFHNDGKDTNDSLGPPYTIRNPVWCWGSVHIVFITFFFSQVCQIYFRWWFHQDLPCHTLQSKLPISSFCRTIWARVQRSPLRTDAERTSRKPAMLNCVDWNVKRNNPPAMNNTTNTNEHLWKKRESFHVFATFSAAVNTASFSFYLILRIKSFELNTGDTHSLFQPEQEWKAQNENYHSWLGHGIPERNMALDHQTFSWRNSNNIMQQIYLPFTGLCCSEPASINTCVATSLYLQRYRNEFKAPIGKSNV